MKEMIAATGFVCLWAKRVSVYSAALGNMRILWIWGHLIPTGAPTHCFNRKFSSLTFLKAGEYIFKVYYF